MQGWIDYLVRVTIQDGRQLVGRFLAFDQHMNLCISECQEFRTVKSVVVGKKYAKSTEYKRNLG